ncbi:MAG TPA: hypothetical protein EYQ50_23490 [Verrucomicrobiales bacterium]|nr:hypothetical protein [Verrucomicrobiales bacterium]
MCYPLMSFAQDPDLGNGLIAHFPFNGSAEDASGNNLESVLEGNPQLTTDRHGNENSAYQFTGSQRLILPDFPMPQDEFSVSFWFYMDTLPEFATGLVTLAIPFGPLHVSVDKDVLRTAWGTGGQGLHYGHPRIETGKWYFYSFSMTNGGNEFSVSLDGIHNRRSTHGDVSDRVFSGDLTFVYEHTFSGKLDDVRIYDRSLSMEDNRNLADLDSTIDSDADGLSDIFETGKGFYEMVLSATRGWNRARNDAERREGYLATFTSSEEWFPFDITNQAGRSFIFGGFMTDRVSRKWEWITGEDWKYANWQSGILHRSAPVPSYTYYSPQFEPSHFQFWLAEPNETGAAYLLETGMRSDPNNPDSDGDGINDGDEVNVHGTLPTSADTDKDGISDRIEIELGLDPLLRSPFPEPTVSASKAIRIEAGNLIHGATYQLEYSDDLKSWKEYGEPFTADGDSGSEYVDVTVFHRFWRASVKL